MLKVSEIFYSIQGESTTMGLPAVFVRLAGCNLNCTYCDTKYARSGGTEFSIEEILVQVKSFNCNRVTITGGEPLLQEGSAALAQRLIDSGYDVQVETNGSQNINLIPEKARCILDIKTPGSGESDRNDFQNIDRLSAEDEIKFVLTSIDDYVWAKDKISEYSLSGRFEILFSPVSDMLSPAVLAEKILTDNLDVRLHLQLHKIIWPDRERGV